MAFVILPPVHWMQVAMDLAPSISEKVFNGHHSHTSRAKSKKLPAGHWHSSSFVDFWVGVVDGAGHDVQTAISWDR